MREREINNLIKDLMKKKQKELSEPPRKISFKYKGTYINMIKEKFGQFWHSESTEEIKPVIKYIISYGLLGYSVYCFIYVTHNILVGILGIGCAIYLAHDTFDFIWERLKIIWERKK